MTKPSISGMIMEMETTHIPRLDEGQGFILRSYRQSGWSRDHHSRLYWRKHHPEIQREHGSWLGDRMAEIKGLEIQAELAILKAHGFGPDCPYEAAEKILDKNKIVLDKP